MKISLKRASRIIPVLFVLVIVAVSLISLVPPKRALAANTVTQPLVWDSPTHDNLVSKNNVVFRDLGWFCPTGAGVQVTSGSGSSIKITSDASASDKTTSVFIETETSGSTTQKTDVPRCDTQAKQAANHAWVTSFPSGTNYVLYVYGTTVNGNRSIDAQHMPISSGSAGTGTTAKLASITGAGTFKDVATIKDIKVDTSKAAIVSAGKASNSDNTVPTDTCPVTSWALRWLACPLFEAADNAINQLEAKVTEYLANDVQGIFGSSNACAATTDTSCAYYQAWNSFRVLAISLIIIVGIIMVVSEATGFAIFDAYTIRKILPRLLISVIFISISWWLMKFVIQFFNNISVWLASLVSFPFKDVTNHNVSGVHPWSVVGQWGVIIGAAALLGPFGLLSYAGTIFLALAVGWLTLVIRRMIIVFAVMSAPLFIACFIMPNTQKMGKFWRDGFIGMLLMGPIFTLAVTLGQITSAIASHGSSSDPSSGDPFGIIAFTALVLPIISIPVLFSKIGGSVAGLVGFMNDKSKGGFDRLKNFRSEEMGRRKERAKSGELFGSGLMRGGAADRLNSFTSKAALGAKGNFGLGAKGREAYDQRMAVLSAQHGKSDAGQAGQFNDDMLRAQTYGSAAEARRNMADDYGMNAGQIDTAIAAARANGGWGKARQVYAAKQLATTGTGYGTSQQMIQTIARASGGNASLGAAMIGEARSASKRAGRSDLGGDSYDNLNNLVQQQITANSGARDANGRPIAVAPSAEQYRASYVRAFQGTDGATLARDKGASITNITQALYGELAAAHDNARMAGTNNALREQYEARAAELNEQIKNFQGTAGIYAAPAHSRTIHNNIIAPDRGPINPATGQYDHPAAPNIIQQVSRQSAPQQTVQEVRYVPQADGSYVQRVTTPAAMQPPPSTTPHMQEAAEVFRSRRGGGADLNDPRLPGDE